MPNFGEIIENIDLSGFKPVDKGTYECRVAEAEAKIAKSGREMISMKFEIAEGPQQGRKFYNNFVWVADNPNAQRMFFVNMGAMGFDKAYFQQNPTMEKLANDMVGRFAKVTVDHREWQGNMQEDVKKIEKSNRTAGGGAVPSGMGGSPASSAAPAAAPAATPQPSATPQPNVAPENPNDPPF